MLTLDWIDEYFQVDLNFYQYWSTAGLTDTVKEKLRDRAIEDLDECDYVGEKIDTHCFPRDFSSIESTDDDYEYLMENQSKVPKDFRKAVCEQIKLICLKTQYDNESLLYSKFGQGSSSQYNVSVQINRNGKYSEEALKYLTKFLVKP